MNTYFVTGSTGFVGINVIRKIIEMDDFNKIFILIRDVHDIEQRFNKLSERYLKKINTSYLRKIELVDYYDFINYHDKYLVDLREVTHILHLLSSVSFTDDYENMKKINVDITRLMLDFSSKLKNIETFTYVSTAYVCGKSSKEIFYEKDLNIGQEFNNNYEKSKYAAEMLVNEYKKRFPIIIIRPSLLVGDSKTGEVINYKMIYPFIKLLSRGKLKKIQCNNAASINIISIDYLVKYMFEIIENKKSVGKTFHLVNESNSNIRELFSISCKVLGRKEPVYEKNFKNIKILEVYFPYLNQTSPVFDMSNTKNILPDYKSNTVDDNLFKILIGYCTKGKFIW